jgi:hypothetical protein
MAKRTSFKFALLAATALAASGAGAAAAVAPARTEILAPVEHAADEAAPLPAAAKLGIAAVLAAAFVNLVGLRRLHRLFVKAGPAAAKAAGAVAKAPVAAARAVVKAAASPFRFALLFGGLGLFALAGVGLYDVEWAAGLLAGLALAALGFRGASGVRRVFARTPAKGASRSEKINQ